MINLIRGIEAAATAEVGPRVVVAAGTYDGGEYLRFATDDGFTWERLHPTGAPLDLPWLAIQAFTRAYREWFDEQAHQFFNTANGGISG